MMTTVTDRSKFSPLPPMPPLPSPTMIPFIGVFTSVLERAIATHSSTLAWKIPWVEEPDDTLHLGVGRTSGLLQLIQSGQSGELLLKTLLLEDLL